MKCKVCGRESRFIFEGLMLNKYRIKYFLCENCKFLQTEEPFWLREAYQNPINISDTGILQRNIYLSKITTLIIFLLFNRKGKFLDYAGGYGIFVRLMRDLGFDFYWYDKYSKNLLARGFEYSLKVGKIDLITCFEGFEHFEDPIKEIENMLRISKNILFTTELLPVPVPKPNEWQYYGLNHGQHISFYSRKTLEFIGERYNLNFYTIGRNIHILTEKNINKFFFYFVPKFVKIGVFDIVRRFLKSKTISDWEKLRE